MVEEHVNVRLEAYQLSPRGMKFVRARRRLPPASVRGMRGDGGFRTLPGLFALVWASFTVIALVIRR